jgi:hypothetical protein
MLWNFHIPGKGNGLVRVKTLRELGGIARAGNRGNKTQAVALSLIKRLPGKGYHVFIDNLFTSTKFLELLRSRRYSVTGTCRTNAGILTELIKINKSDKNDIIP